jgi:phosphoglycerate dehydrogenase-like enzyme
MNNSSGLFRLTADDGLHSQPPFQATDTKSVPRQHLGGTKALRVALAADIGWLEPAVTNSGGEVVEPANAVALVWGREPSEQLATLLGTHPDIRWVQLIESGVEAHGQLFRDGRLWTCGKGQSAEAVAEHALALLLAGFRNLKVKAQASSWGPVDGRTLYDKRVTIVGGGGIAHELIRLLSPFRVRVTVVRKHPHAMRGVDEVLQFSELQNAVKGSDAVVVAGALTSETRGAVDISVLKSMGSESWLVNVARGAWVVTDDLTEALTGHWIAGASLDVTDPEPLPDGHPLWYFDNCLITPHSANPATIARPSIWRRVEANVRNYREGKPMTGVVDPELGY